MLFSKSLDALAAVLRLAGRDQRGQGTVEYVGVILLVGLLIGAVGGAITGQADKLAKTIATKVDGAINDVTGGDKSPSKKDEGKK